ncbi:AMP-binding protein [Cellulomonas fengjieae]|uniref:AMP-binding protein n=1 Tax=Cellulomonas fengjieae TaxID=2819978 RepID=A0ABS3SFN9_9CELL|nr:AMP-binding protein [Cellulomonas fengjieae]MBO3084467.1 AMP-binding protein [Cellulomonas fengjieae]QVI67196.1 AMP-binding protein [Cellulomonas fengjieae]
MPTTDRVPDDRGVPDPVLGEYTAMGALALTDAERWPTLDEAGLAPLVALRHHPDAPPWVHATGDRLTAADEPALAAARPADAGWIADLVARAHASVPAYRRAARAGRSGPTTPLAELPTVTRHQLVDDLAAYVPVDVPLDRVLEGTSSGSTGAALRIPLHPASVAADLVLLQRLVAEAGAVWEPDPARLGLANVVDQRAAFTYASVMTAFRRQPGAPAPLMARVNLSGWPDAASRDRFLTDLDPQVLSTSTLPLLRLLELDLALHPVAVVNGATHLPAAVRAAALARWGCPVLDLYGLRETGPVAVSAGGDGHVVVPRRVHVEILDATGAPVPDGTRGEVVVTVDENPYLPLLRYRTGDHAALVRDARGTVLVGLEGRAPVLFRAADGTARPSVDASQVLQAHGLAAYHLHQDADGSVHLRALPLRGLGADPRAAADAVARWLERPVALTVLDDVGDLGDGKPRRFSTAFSAPG